MIKNATDLIEMRRLRNEITHGYRAKDYSALFITIGQQAQVLCNIIDEVSLCAMTLKKTGGSS